MINKIKKVYHVVSSFITSLSSWFQDLYDEASGKKKIPDSSNKITGFTCGSFDLLHAGHVLMLKEAKSHCDYLIVGLQYDPSIDRPEKNKPVQTIEERAITLESISYVDKIILYETEADLQKILVSLDCDVRVIGADWKGKKYTGWDLNIPVVFNGRDHNWSTTGLRDRVFISELRRRNRYEEKKTNKE